jgi:hypothetical protein
VVTFAIQYLEPGPGVAAISPDDARARLRAALEWLPISHVLLGWNLPEQLLAVCREQATKAGAQLYLWHPFLTGDGDLFPQQAWRTIGSRGEPVPGFQGMPEFTFICPNRPQVREAVLDHLSQVLRRADYDGVFLDRIRFPSPAADPGRWLACFCPDCRRAAERDGLDLHSLRASIDGLLATPERVPPLLQALLGSRVSESTDPDIAGLNGFLDFRERSVSRLVSSAVDLIHAEGLAVGLDCFSPALTRMVGQDLNTLGKPLKADMDWIKVMLYGHTLGPAGLPFELLALGDWLVAEKHVTERQALEWLSQATGLPLPASRDELRSKGLAPAAIGAEVQRARAAGVRNLLAGIELVEVEGVTSLNQTQIKADLRAIKTAGAAGLALSWDLWHIALERLGLVRATWT